MHEDKNAAWKHGVVDFYNNQAGAKNGWFFASARFDFLGWLAVFFCFCAAAAMAVGARVAAGLAFGAGEATDFFEEDSCGGQEDRRADGGAEHVFLLR